MTDFNNEQLPIQISNAIDTLSENQLRYLYRLIADRLKLMNSAKTINALAKFKLNDIVSFNHNGNEITGRIIRINQKTVSLLTLDGKHKWNVSPSFINKILQEKTAEYYEKITNDITEIISGNTGN